MFKIASLVLGTSRWNMFTSRRVRLSRVGMKGKSVRRKIVVATKVIITLGKFWL